VCRTLLLVALASLAFACGSVPFVGQPAPTGPEEPADFVQLERVAPTDRVHIDRRWLVQGSNVLVTPHTTLAVAWVEVADRLDAGAAAAVHLPAGAHAGAGRELAVAGLARPSLPAPYADPAARLSAALAVDGRTVPLARVPEPDDVLAVSVPRGTPLRLEITDAGRPVGFDLRRRRPAPDSLSRYYPRHTGPRVSYGADGRLQPGGSNSLLSVSVVSAEFALEPWTPTRGWARPGRAWLRSDHTTAVSYNMRTAGVSVDVDLSRTFTLALPEGQAVAAAPLTIHALTDTRLTDASLEFDVPDTFSAGTLGADARGLTVTRDADHAPVAWTQIPPPRQFPIQVPPSGTP
jgi:hypothetical protein